MQKINFENNDRPLKILCIGSHSDDIEIGCGGTILKLLNENTAISVDWVVLSAGGLRNAEATGAAEEFLDAADGYKIRLEDFKDGFFPFRGEEVKSYFEHLKTEMTPDIIFTHYRGDLHQDHRFTSELTWNTFRDHLILEYEIFKYDGDIGTPNFFVHLSENVSARKIEILLKHHHTQGNKDWFASDTFFSLMRLRGVESRAPNRYAEAFHARKLVY